MGGIEQGATGTAGRLVAGRRPGFDKIDRLLELREQGKEEEPGFEMEGKAGAEAGPEAEIVHPAGVGKRP